MHRDRGRALFFFECRYRQTPNYKLNPDQDQHISWPGLAWRCRTMSGKTRSLFGTAFKHFVNSLKPRASPGQLVGRDQHGNKYFEIAADPSRGKRYPKRWLVPVSEAKFTEETVTLEWNAWLRNRRNEPPTEAEISANIALSKMKKENADKLDEKAGRKADTSQKHKHMSDFPVYEEYEVTPGSRDNLK